MLGALESLGVILASTWRAGAASRGAAAALLESSSGHGVVIMGGVGGGVGRKVDGERV